MGVLYFMSTNGSDVPEVQVTFPAGDSWHGGIKINEKLGYGLGLSHSQEQGLEVLSHGGNTLGFTSDTFFLPAQNLGVVLLTNLRMANAFLAALRQRILEIVFDAARRFYLQFESRGSALGTEFQQEGKRLIALTSPPWSGGLRFKLLRRQETCL